MSEFTKKLLPFISILGIGDSGFLTFEHYSNSLPPCNNNWWADCGKVLNSSYSMVGPIPLALIGLIHYFLLTVLLIIVFRKANSSVNFFVVIQSLGGFLVSLYFVYIQLGILHSVCLYCMASAIISAVLFYCVQSVFSTERCRLTIFVAGALYRSIIKPVLFTIDPELVHVQTVRLAQWAGDFTFLKALASYCFKYKNSPVLAQKVDGIYFENPVGLAAGFDYEARLTQILPSAGFGFMSVGTITNQPYTGNPKPMLGRLPRSKSLMVNKGYKNLGAIATSQSLSLLSFPIPVGISIGRTNTPKITTQKQSVQDIVSAFKIFEKQKIKNSYYELNISCPNLYGDISFYPSKNLEELLAAVDSLKLKKPVFIKMPIDKSDSETLRLLRIIGTHSIHGVIIGNLQKNRRDESFISSELSQFPVGNFSGKPTYKRSNELIRLAYKHFHKRFIIIGCGGIFSAEDAYEKIRCGATLLQLITGMVFEGPGLISQINIGLTDLLKRDKFNHISQAIGTK